VGQPVQGAELDYVAWKTDSTDLFWLPPEVLTNEGIAKPVSNKDGMITLSGIPKGATCQDALSIPTSREECLTNRGWEGEGPVEMK